MDAAILGCEEVSERLYDEAGRLAVEPTSNAPEMSVRICGSKSKWIRHMQSLCFRSHEPGSGGVNNGQKGRCPKRSSEVLEADRPPATTPPSPPEEPEVEPQSRLVELRSIRGSPCVAERRRVSS